MPMEWDEPGHVRLASDKVNRRGIQASESRALLGVS